MRSTDGTNVQEVFQEVTKAIIRPWVEMIKRKPEMRSPHWNTKLHTLWKAMQKARRAAKRSGLDADRSRYVEKRNNFERENRRFRRSFERKTEARIRKGDNDLVAGAIKTDARRRKEREKEQTAQSDPINPADFTTFMGSYHDQEQELVELQPFVTPEDLANDIERSIKKSRHNKAPGSDGVHNEVLKANAGAIAKLLTETWALIGRVSKCPEEWKQGLLTPIFKKGERALPQNYRPICMLSCARKVIETAIAERIARNMPIFGRQFGFQRVL